MECKLKLMTKWLTDTGLQVNESKTEICLFHKNPQIQVELLFNNELFKSKNTINVLGVTFDSMMKWDYQIAPN